MPCGPASRRPGGAGALRTGADAVPTVGTPRRTGKGTPWGKLSPICNRDNLGR